MRFSVEWVETTGNTIDEAKELALDQLGVDGGDAEFEILEEPKVGLFGRTRGVARVRARVSPRSPRPKTERRRRTNKRDDAGDQKPARAERTPSANGDGEPDAAPKPAARKTAPKAAAPTSGQESEATARPGRNERSKPAREPMDEQEQVEVLTSFLEGLGTSFGLEVTTEAAMEDDEVRVNLRGDGLGVLVGPRLATLDAIQEIARNALQRQADGREYARVVVDVQDIRQRRKQALGEFVADAAEQVRTEGVTVVFEVMSSADRKIVHDVTTSLEGVVSASEGEDPRRRVVLRPA
jgi:spoIIIJ-associated protein